jgi:hypothetical protein
MNYLTVAFFELQFPPDDGLEGSKNSGDLLNDI